MKALWGVFYTYFLTFKGFTMNDKTYNGWTNYATWRVNLEIFDNWRLGDIAGYEDQEPETAEAYELGQILKQYVEELLDEQSPSDGIANAYAHAFIDEVNWFEIAQHMIEDEIQSVKA